MIGDYLIDPDTASAEIDLGALRANLASIAEVVAPAGVMLIVKADGYGHGMSNVAQAARSAVAGWPGCEWLGVATPQEAAMLRKAGDQGKLLSWLYGDSCDLAEFVAMDIDLGLHRIDQLDRLRRPAAQAGRPARIHLKVDTGLHRNGAPLADWPQLCAAAAAAEARDEIEVIAVWSHFAAADQPGHRSLRAQRDAFAYAERVALDHGLRPQLRHLANSAAALADPDSRGDLVRVGIAAYGVDPADDHLAANAGVVLRPVMRLRARLVAVKPLRAGESVSYGWTWTASEDTVVGLVPLGYADGIPVAASNRGSVRVGDRLAPIRGRVCMDQFLIDLGPDAQEEPGAEVVVIGHPEGPRAEDWARATGTIGYEIVTRIGPRVPRVIVDDHG